MRTILLGVFFLIYASVACAQVEAPDYTNTSEWKYFECGEIFLEPNDINYTVWHEDYSVVKINPNKDSVLTLMYKPIKWELVKKLGRDKAITASRENPWLLFSVSVEMLEGKPSSPRSIQLFEYVNGSWKYVGTFKTEQETEELRKILRDRYDLNVQ